MKVCVIGLGYIGLPTAALLARGGNTVIGVDKNPSVLENIRKTGGPPEEPGLRDLVLEMIREKKLILSPEPEPCDAFILCLPTPIKEDHTPNLSYVEKGMASIIPHVKKGDIVVLESTVPPGTTRDIVGGMLKKKGLDPEKDVYVAHAPERVLPGKILDEMVNLDRVIGGLTLEAAERARDLYTSYVKGNIFLADATTAEFVKLAENAYRDVNIAFANELAVLAEKLGIDVWHAIEIANRHPRVTIHRPGPGVGGHCIAVDPYFLIAVSEERTRLMQTARDINNSMPDFVLKKAKKILGSLRGKKIAVLGIAYKGNVGDTRESPSLEVIKRLKKEGVICRVHDPYVDPENSPEKLVSLEEAVENADMVIITTDHGVFRDIDPGHIGSLVAEKILFDTRHIVNGEEWAGAGWDVVYLGDGEKYAT